MLKRSIALEDRKMGKLGRRAVLIGILAVFCGNLPAANAAQSPWVDPDDIQIPELHKIKEIKPDRVELKNGMVVYFLEDHDFPVVDVRAIMRVGSIYEPAEKVGLAEITGQVMRTGGSTTTDGDALDEKLESLGASVEISIGNTQGFATVSTLSEDLGEGLRILSELLRHPAFPEDKIDLAKKQQRTAIAARNDEHLEILFREMLALIYGKDHPYGRHTEYATIDAITRDDLVAFHKDYVFPDRIIMTVYGDFKTKDVQKLLSSIFGDWARSTKPLPPDPEVEPSEIEGNFLADKKDLTNSVIVVGQEGMRMDNPDYAAMQVFHEVMGAPDFSSRLMNEIRSKRGLAYATGSFSGAGLHHAGPQGFYVITQAESTVVTLNYLDDEIEKGLSEPFTDEELKLAKDSILNSLVFSLSSKGDVLNRMASYEFYGYPMDFLTRYQENVQSVTAEQVLAAAKRNFRYPAVATIIVGERSKFESDLASLGDVTELDISIPEPEGEEIPEATAADLERGQALLAEAAAACGGPAMAKLTDMTVEATGSFVIQGTELQLSVTTVKQFPDCEHNEIKLPMGTVIQSICGDVAWVDQGQGAKEMPADMKQGSAAEQPRDLVNVLTRYQDLELQALPRPADVGGRPADVVFVHSDDIQGWKIYLDQETHLIVRMDYRDKSPMGTPVSARELIKDYQDMGDGISWPHTREILHDDEPFITLAVTSVKFNTGVDPGIFAMPE